MQAVIVTDCPKWEQTATVHSLSESKGWFYIYNLFKRKVSQGVWLGKLLQRGFIMLFQSSALVLQKRSFEKFLSQICFIRTFSLNAAVRTWAVVPGKRQKLAFRSFSFTLIRSFWLPLIGCVVLPCVCLTASPFPSAHFINISLLKVHY